MDRIAQLREKQPISWIKERDVDLLICAELHANHALHQRFADEVGLTGCTFEGAWVSQMEVQGESDIVLCIRNDDGLHLILVEDKIAAEFQPNQADRYHQRAAHWTLEDGVTSCSTMLLAPESYLHGATEQNFDATLSFEDIVQELESATDPRSLFTARTLKNGIEAARVGYQMVPDAQVTSIWHRYHALAKQHAPELRMEPPGERPSRSVWAYFRDAAGFEGQLAGVVDLVHKANCGHVDLRFGGTSPSELARLCAAFLATEMKVVKAGKSASIRIELPSKVDFEGGLSSQDEAILTGLRVAEQLRQFFVDHRSDFAELIS